MVETFGVCFSVKGDFREDMEWAGIENKRAQGAKESIADKSGVIRPENKKKNWS
jgi:hypothetical protein